MNNHEPLLMDCTLRDGSYVIDFQFNQKDTFDLTQKLSESKIPLIEVGHGIGLGASKKGLGTAACSDEEYCISASEGIRGNSKWGMFCIPGISSIDDLKMAISYGIDFIRIGSDIDDIESSKKYIEIAKNAGLQVFSNFMKSYKTDPKGFAELAKKSADYGTDVVYIVDSSGGMYPEDLKIYIRETLDKNLPIELGFHGHNNLGMGMANCLVSLQEGVKYLDSSLQGLGRSAGNVSTEHLLCAIKNQGFLPEIDPIEVMDIGEIYVRPLISSYGFSSLDITAGWTLFHSSHMPTILMLSKKNQVDPRKLIKYIFDHKIENLNVENLEKMIHTMKKSINVKSQLKKWPTYFGEEEKLKK